MLKRIVATQFLCISYIKITTAIARILSLNLWLHFFGDKLCHNQVLACIFTVTCDFWVLSIRYLEVAECLRSAVLINRTFRGAQVGHNEFLKGHSMLSLSVVSSYFVICCRVKLKAYGTSKSKHLKNVYTIT